MSGARQRHWVPVERKVPGRKGDEPVPDRQDALRTTAEVAVPKLEMSAVSFAPVVIEIQEGVDAPVQAIHYVEVGMQIKLCAWRSKVNACSRVKWVIEQWGNARQAP